MTNHIAKSTRPESIKLIHNTVMVSHVLLLYTIYRPSLVPRPLPAFQCFQRATLKSWEWPGDEANTGLLWTLLNTHETCTFVGIYFEVESTEVYIGIPDLNYPFLDSPLDIIIVNSLVPLQALYSCLSTF